MCAAVYTEPDLSILVLDFLKEEETRACLESVRRHIRVPYKVIYLHNGPADYPVKFLQEGLVDQLIQTRQNTGLGIGTRDLFAASFSKYSLYLQNDQIVGRNLGSEEFGLMLLQLGQTLPGDIDCSGPITLSISLAGSPCGTGIYSERAHLIYTDHYKQWDVGGFLGYHGAGPYHDGVWRERQLQDFYKNEHYIHYEWPTPLVMDNGRRAIRQNPDGSKWKHFPDTKQCWLISGPVKERHVYPKFTDAEWTEVLNNQSWPPGLIPEQERRDSFHVWN